MEKEIGRERVGEDLTSARETVIKKNEMERERRMSKSRTCLNSSLPFDI